MAIPIPSARTLRWLALLAVAGVLPPAHALALDPSKVISQYRQSAWTGETGLPSAGVLTMVQTRDGYIWMGTEEGLVRFDGVRFTTYTTGNTPSIPHRRITALGETPAGTLIIGTADGLVFYKDGLFTRAGTPRVSGITSILPRRDGTLWIVAEGHLWQLAGDHLAPASPARPSGDINAVAQSADGTDWIGTEAALISIRDGRTRTYTTKDGLVDGSVNFILPARDGTVWVGTTRGLSTWKNGAFTTRLHARPGVDDPLEPLFEDANGAIWAGTTNSGVIRFIGDRVERYRQADGLLTNEVRSFLEDREGSLWIGTYAGGVQRFADASFTSYGPAEGLRTSGRSITQTGDGAIWVGLVDGTVHRRLPGSATFHDMAPGVSGAGVLSLKQGRDEALWIGSDGGGLLRYPTACFVGTPPRTACPETGSGRSWKHRMAPGGSAHAAPGWACCRLAASRQSPFRPARRMRGCCSAHAMVCCGWRRVWACTDSGTARSRPCSPRRVRLLRP